MRERGKVMEDILLIAITIVGNILGILILNNVNVSKRILLILGMDIFYICFISQSYVAVLC